jgi:hypothetical protein
VDRAVDRFEQLPENRGREVAKDGAATAGEHRCHKSPMEAETSVTDRVDAMVHTVKLPALHASRYPVLANPEVVQLGNRDHPMLLSGKSGERQIDRVTLLPHVED